MSNSNGRSPQAQIVVDAIDRLPPTERALLDLSVRHEMDDGEIAAIVGLDPREVTRLRLGVLERMTSEFASLGLGRWGALGAALHEDPVHLPFLPPPALATGRELSEAIATAERR